jgi:hypothetical protein
MFVTMVAHHVGHSMHAFPGVRMVHAPWQKRQGDQNHGAPLFRRFVRLHPKIGQAPRLFAIEVVHCNGPALLRDRQDVLCRSRESGAQQILRVCLPMVPLTEKDTDCTWPRGKCPLERSHQGGPLPSAWSGELHALIPRRPERWGPLRELLVIERAIGRDRTHHLPVPTATACEPAIGSLPTVQESRDVASRRPQPLECLQHVVGQQRCLAQTPPLVRGSLLVETPHGLLPQGEAPLLGVGTCPAFEADFAMHRSMRVAGLLLPLALGVIVVRGHGFARSRVLVFFASRVIQTPREGPWIGLLGVGHSVSHNTGAHRCPEVLSCPGAHAERIRPMRGVGCLDTKSRQAGKGFLPGFRDHQRIGEAQHMLQLRRGEASL